ncbi:MAG: transposase [Gammaproteobacteria bacterium]|nr:transposase [Gammaproteobacteria bacterium]
MATPRHLLVDPVNECDYHLVSRCVRRAFLCGVDEHDGRDYSHRRTWLVERMRQLALFFAVDIYSYTVLSNHFHLVLRHDPLAHRDWNDEEVARRWFEAFPPTERAPWSRNSSPNATNSCWATRTAWRAPAARWDPCRTS